MRKVRRTVLALGAGASAGAAAFALLVRPRIRRWGTTGDEFTKALPGDEIEGPAGHRLISTRAITVDAPPEAVWPWLVQMGHTRAGFYTHEWVERLFGITYADGHSANRIHPELQDVRLGTRIPYSPLNQCEVVVFDPPHAFMAGEWLVLEPLDGGTRTRLLARSRGSWLEWLARGRPHVSPFVWPLAALVDRGPGELLHHYMETGMLKGIKQRVEAEQSRSLDAGGSSGAARSRG